MGETRARRVGTGTIGALLGAILASSTGCASLVGTAIEPGTPYVGVTADAELVRSGRWPFLIDLPASAVLDTVFLPVTVTGYVVKKGQA